MLLDLVKSSSSAQIYLAGVAVVCTLAYLFRPPRLRYVPRPPVPSWLWGHDLAIYSVDAGVKYREWFDTYGPLFKIRGAFCHPEILVAADLGVTNHILQTNIYDYHHSKIVRPRIERLLGRSLGWVEGAEEHRRMRKLVSAGLTVNMVNALSPIIYDSANRITGNLIDAVVNTSKTGTKGTVVNILDWTGKATLEITGRASFDHDFDGGEAQDAQAILGAWRRMATVGISRMGFVALMLLRRFPFLNHIPIKANRAHSVVKMTIQDGVAKEMLARSAKHEDGKPEKGRNDLLTLLLNAHAQGELPTQELMDHLSMFIMAGHETTSQTLAFTIWELAQHPDKQTRLREEVMAHNGPDPTFADFMGKLPYLDAVVRESLRMHPALPYMERVATKDDILPLATPLTKPDGTQLTQLPIKAGQIIVTPIISIHQQAAVWGPDAAEWKPERWLSPSTLPDPKTLPSGWGNLLAFSDGPRNCVGWRLGLFQYKVILMALVRDLVFVDTGVDIASKIASSLQPCVRDEIGGAPKLPIEVKLVD